MGKTIRAQRDGTGPKKGSYQDRVMKIGRRQADTIACPKKVKKSK